MVATTAAVPVLPAATAADIAETQQAAETVAAAPSGEEDTTPTESETVEHAATAGAALTTEEKRTFIKTTLVKHGVPWAVQNLNLPKNPGMISSWSEDLVNTTYDLALAKG